jgi:hypothetical protein
MFNIAFYNLLDILVPKKLHLSSAHS